MGEPDFDLFPYQRSTAPISSAQVMGSARPKLMLFPGGPLLLSGGRPGLSLWVNPDADGELWT